MHSPFNQIDYVVKRAAIILSSLLILLTVSTGYTYYLGSKQKVFDKYVSEPIFAAVSKVYTEMAAREQWRKDQEAAHQAIVKKQQDMKAQEANQETIIITPQTNQNTNPTTEYTYPTPTSQPSDTSTYEDARAAQDEWWEQVQAENAAKQAEWDQEMEDFKAASDQRMEDFKAEAEQGLEDFREENGIE